MVDVSPNFWPLVEVFFSQKWVFFRNFRDISTNTTPKITFYCIFINNFLKESKKVLRNFSGAFGAAKKLAVSNIFPWSKGHFLPPLPPRSKGQGGQPPPLPRGSGAPGRNHTDRTLSSLPATLPFSACSTTANGQKSLERFSLYANRSKN